MSKEYKQYEAAVHSFTLSKEEPQSNWARLCDWYKAGGRQEFIEAFAKEAGITITNGFSPDDLVAAALPKSIGDLEKKIQGDAFYRAHATWFLEEMDYVIACVPKHVADPVAASALREVLLFVRPVMLDSVLLFEDWGRHRAGVPGVYGMHKNIAEHMMAFYQGARQTIYGHGSFKLSFIDNHADLATATIRQAIEIRLRRAFGIMGKIKEKR